MLIAFNVSSEGFVISVHFNNDDHWDYKRGKIILTCLIKRFKLDKLGYTLQPHALKHSMRFWFDYRYTVEYFTLCKKFGYEVFKFDPEYLEYSSEYNF